MHSYQLLRVRTCTSVIQISLVLDFRCHVDPYFHYLFTRLLLHILVLIKKKNNISNTLPQYSKFIIIVGKCYFRILIQPIMVSIWRNRVHFTNLHSGHIVIIMAIFSTIEYIERNEKNHQFLKMSILEIFRRHLVSLFTFSGIGMRLFCLKEFLLNLQNRSGAFRNKVCVKVMKELMKGF